MKLYHGTRGTLESIRKHGVLIHGFDNSKEETCDRILAEFGLTRKDVPEWIYRGELHYEEGKADHVHCCPNFKSAIGYADMGGEPAFCIRCYLLRWLNRHRLNALMSWDWRKKRGCPPYYRGKYSETLKELNRQAKLINGTIPYVVEIELDESDGALDQWTNDTIIRLRKAGYWPNETNMEVRVWRDIRPDEIVSITPVDKEIAEKS